MVEFRSKRTGPVPARTGATSGAATPLTGRDKRRGVRVNSRVPVAVEWDSGSEMRRWEAQTRVVGPYGCLVVLPQDIELQQQVKVTNLVSSESNPAVVVYRGSERAEGWELGIELVNPQVNFWGLDL